MKTLPVSVLALSEEVIKLQYYLEDHYESPTLAKDLKKIRTKLTKLIEYKPTYVALEKNDLGIYHRQLNHLLAIKDTEELANTAYSFQLGCMNALPYLENVTAKSNVFDIIDALKQVYHHVMYYVGSYEEHIANF